MPEKIELPKIKKCPWCNQEPKTVIIDGHFIIYCGRRNHKEPQRGCPVSPEIMRRKKLEAIEYWNRKEFDIAIGS